MDIYLHSSGVPRRVIETLARFGVCSPYRAILLHLGRLADQTGLNLKRVAHDPSALFVYDNFNFKDSIRDISLGRGTALSSRMLIIDRAVAGLRTSGIINGAITIVSSCAPLEKRPG
ncbi:hypothetical protein M434DRAFT_394568 [Hypoxylon sp. CO27-5]|nr:hypothetical protein M434DRAFT_394568 [Hypoxylon sp. CO27-5]